jgi:SIR2-like domain
MSSDPITELPSQPSPSITSEIEFIKGAEPIKLHRSGTPESESEDALIKKIRESLSEAMSAKNVAFLLGSGCSSLLNENEEQLGIPTMKPLAKEFSNTTGGRGSEIYLNSTEKKVLRESLGLNVEEKPYSENLETLMEKFYSWKFSLKGSTQNRHNSPFSTVEKAILKVKRFLFEKCSSGQFSGEDGSVQNLYESFYRKLIYRDRSLPRPWIFTTNYDLFNETAMDRLGLPYSNGFIGTIERRFNPSVFRYALAEQLDVTSRKWSAVDGFVYLGKLHGSITWIEDQQGLFPIRELQRIDENFESLMIYPTPAKQAFSFSSPYSDLFREFQARIVQEQSVLFVVGYGFGDEHINNIIYQALTVPTFRLVVLATPDAGGEISKLRKLKDPRIWIIGSPESSMGRNAHYFDYFVENLMPELPGDQVDLAVKKVLNNLMGRGNSSGGQKETVNDA